MAKYSIADIPNTKLSDKDLKKIYEKCKKDISSSKGSYPKFDFSDLDYIFTVACGSRALFPKINTGEDSTPTVYISRWISSYCNAKSNPASKKTASKKSSCNDPIIKTIIINSQGITATVADSQITTHNLCMSAENILGNLLEEYLSTKLRKYGWVWCAGKTLRAIDFCSEKGTILLQVKNKSNSENSSSSNIRTGTTIKKWYRLGTSTRGGVLSPSYKWDKLNDIINDNLPKGASPIKLTEKDFENYISKIVKANKKIITGE